MQSPITRLGLAFFTALGLLSSTLAQDQQIKKPDADPAIGNSAVSGRAVYDDTELPATRHRIQLVSSQFLMGLPARFRLPTAMTNENGEFILRRIAAGEYYVVPQAIDTRPGNTGVFPFIGRSGDRAADTAKVEQFKKDYTRIVVDGLQNLTINLRVPNQHLGSISGRVLDSSGTPAVQATVLLMSKGEKGFGASALSDEQGRYKILGLPAGEYIVSANPPVKRPAGEDRRSNSYEGILGATFFPSTLESRNSPPVEVLADRDTGNIDITLLARSLHGVAGTIVYKGTNQPVATATVRIWPERDSSTKPGIEGAMSHYFSATDKNGHWSVVNVPDGNYRLRVEPDVGARGVTEKFVAVEQNVKIEGADVEGLRIEVSMGTSVSGVVIIEGENTELQFINVAANRYKGNAGSHARIKGAGNFTLTSVAPGEVVVSAFPFPQEKFYVKSIEANGIDLLRSTNLNISEGEEIKDVRIVVSSSVGVVSGRVLSEKDNKPIQGIDVLLRRISEDKLRLFGGRLTTTTDENGNYLLSAAPGVYLLVAWRTSDGPGAFGAAMEKASREQGSGLILLPNDRKQLDLRVP